MISLSFLSLSILLIDFLRWLSILLNIFDIADIFDYWCHFLRFRLIAAFIIYSFHFHYC
jgi:hypothetical protein